MSLVVVLTALPARLVAVLRTTTLYRVLAALLLLIAAALGVVPDTVLVPALAASLVLRAGKVWQHSGARAAGGRLMTDRSHRPKTPSKGGDEPRGRWPGSRSHTAATGSGSARSRRVAIAPTAPSSTVIANDIDRAFGPAQPLRSAPSCMYEKGASNGTPQEGRRSRKGRCAGSAHRAWSWGRGCAPDRTSSE